MQNDIIYSNTFQSTPSAWRETAILPVSYFTKTFQSTPSAWRETQQALLRLSGDHNFNPLPPHGGRRGIPPKKRIISADISIHSLRMEGDISLARRMRKNSLFQSTPSAWRETAPGIIFLFFNVISIHSLRMEGDTLATICQRNLCISIHSLRMEGDRFLDGSFFE